MTVARPFYAARILGTPDVPVSVREDSGRLVLDSARAPHVSGNVVLSVPDAAMLEDLDPRDARRLVLDVFPESHLEPVYSAWTEQRRNLATNPRGLNTIGWSSNDGGPYPVTRGVTPPVPHPIGIATAVECRNSGTNANVVLASLYNADALGLAGTPTRMLGVWVLVNQPGYRMQATGNVTWPADELPVNQWTWVQSLTPALAGTFATVSVYKITGNTPTTARAYLTGLLARAGTAPVGDYFDGGTNPSGELSRTRWVAAASASASVLETRTQTDTVQVPNGSPRSFNLGIREATPARGAATVQVQLGSDEELLDDFAQLVGDKGPRAHQTSLRAVVNYVLGKIGAALQPGTTDADVTAYWQVVNQITNPRLVNDAVGWQTGSGASAGGRVVMSSPLPPVGTTAYRWTAAAGESNVVPVTSRYRVTPGKWYVFTAWICSGTARQARAAIQWWSAGGSVASSTALGALVTSDVTAFRQVYVIAKCPPGAEEAVPYVSTLGNAAGNLHYATMGMLYAGDELVPYFDGATADSATYEYEFQAAAHNSTSTRTPTIERPPAALTWKAGVSGLQFLAPLVQASGFRLVCNERREWTLRDAEYREPGAQTFREGVNITVASEQLSRSSEDWYDGIVFVYTWTDDDGIEQTMDDAYALPGATKIIRREIRAPFPGPGRAKYAVTRAQGRGRTVTATKQADWTEAAEQTFSALLDGTPIQIGTANRVEFDIGANEVTTASRTTDTPPGAIVLLTGTINALTGTINNL